MKNFTLIALVSLLFSGLVSGQQEKGITGYENWLKPWTEFKPNKVDYGTPTEIISGNITEDTKLYKKHTYLLLGDVYVTDSTTLIIEPGTVIMGDFKTKGALIVSKDSKIIAKGTSTDPIIFTSSNSVKKPGDWGGLFILGDAPISNLSDEASLNHGLIPPATKNISYGGNNQDSDSGILRYVRIEYAGKRTKLYGYFNGLTLAGVGYQTVIDNVMVSFCKGTSFNVLGGNVVLDRLVSYKSSIHDYEFNYGVQCNITNSLAVKSPYVSGSTASKSMNILAYNLKEEIDLSKPQTNIWAENLTLLNVSNDLENDIKVGLVNEAIFIGENTFLSMNKSVVSGFNPAVILDEKIKLNSANLEDIRFTKMYFNNCNGNIFKKGFSNNDDLENWYGSYSFSNVYSKGPDSETFIDSGNSRYPDFRLRINKIIAAND
ncbi:hypothetical protein [Winogradskyella sp. 3972H.M.0a.05]|uniref:hypothetical protein n=1 Tax=Winogradskyella sp. 3972H.M.0a.05 TaxID=2950277 RepID=UPI00339A7BB2